MFRSRRVWAEHLGGHLLVGEFVHVKETAGWDAGKLKVYQIRSIDREEQILRVVYWEQPRHKSALDEHDYESAGFEEHKLLPEIVLTPEEHKIGVEHVEELPVFAFHWRALKKRHVAPVGINGAYTFGRRVYQTSGGVWKSAAVEFDDHPLSPTSPDKSDFMLRSGLVSRTLAIWDTYRQVADAIRSILYSGSTQEYAKSTVIHGFSALQWCRIKDLHPSKPVMQADAESSTLLVGSELTFHKLTTSSPVERLNFTTMADLECLTEAFGRFWNCAVYPIKIRAEGDDIIPNKFTNIKTIHPNMDNESIPESKRDGRYRATKKAKRRAAEEGAGASDGSFESTMRAPGVYLAYTSRRGGVSGALTVAVSWHDKTYLAQGWEHSVAPHYLV